jgi:phage terminase Nu1 subunit (DNA packaging protein)
MSAQPSEMRLLNSWKEIATYLGRGVRTVQRWEKIGLPVRRLGQGARAPVVADARDLDRWVLGAAHVNGIKTPQSLTHLVFRGQLADSVEQARRLRDEMHALVQSSRMSMARLTESLAAMEKSCVSSHLDTSEAVGPRHRRRARERVSGRSRRSA